MNYNDINKQRLIDALLSSSGGKLSRDTINRAADSKDASSLINSLSPEDRERLLKSPQAQLILKSVLKDGKNDGRTGR